MYTDKLEDRIVVGDLNKKNSQTAAISRRLPVVSHMTNTSFTIERT